MEKTAQAVCGHDGANSFMHGASKAPLRLHLRLDRVKWMAHDGVCSAEQRARAHRDGVFAIGLASSPFGRRHARCRGYLMSLVLTGSSHGKGSGFVISSPLHCAT